jgi:enoyl-CoA hydratase/carnithine racemase
VSIEVDSDFVATVEIHRPPNNYIDAALIAALADAYEGLDEDRACRAIVLCSESDHTRTGGLALIEQRRHNARPDRVRPRLRRIADGSSTWRSAAATLR